MVIYLVLVGAVALERLAELIVSRRNLAWSLANGGQETGRGHFPAMVALHTLLLVACVVEVLVADRQVPVAFAFAMVVLVLASQALRWWCIAVLGRQWNTRIVVTPGFPPVRSGPYRLLRHPNYLAVAVEGAALPLVHGAYLTAVVFTVLNAWLLLAVRIPRENAALRTLAPQP